MSQGPFDIRIAELLKRQGMPEFSPTSSRLFQSFGDAEVVVSNGVLCLRFTRDRGQEFVEVLGPGKHEKFYPFSDLEVAMGWRLEPDLDRNWPEALEEVLTRLRARLPELNAAFSSKNEEDTLRRLEAACERRVMAMKAWWQRNSDVARKKRQN